MESPAKAAYVRQYWPLAVIAGKRFELNPVTILAQAAQESGWGQSFSVSHRRNHFGMLAMGSTNDFWDGTKSQSTTSGLWFRVYATSQDSFLDFARLISTKYPGPARVSFDTDAYAAAIAASAYIAEKNGDNREVYRRNVAQAARYIAGITRLL